MTTDLAVLQNEERVLLDLAQHFPIIQNADPKTQWRFIDFFTSTIKNPNTREAYARAVDRFFTWCDRSGVSELQQIKPFMVATYIASLEASGTAKPTIKQHLSALNKLFNWLVAGNVGLEINPASAVRGPKHIVRQGKTPVLSADQTRHLLDSIALSTIVGLRDRALLGVMVYTFGRVGAVVDLKVEDYYQSGKRWLFRLHEKGGKEHVVPAHHNAEAYVDAYLDSAGIRGDRKGPLFRSVHRYRHRELTGNPLHRVDVHAMIKRRTKSAGLPATVCCHTFRATGITAYLSGGGTLENARAIAAHESSQTTRLYDRTGDKITLDEVERIII